MRALLCIEFANGFVLPFFSRGDWSGLELGMPRLQNMNGKIADTLQRHEREEEPRHWTLDVFRSRFFFPLSLSLHVSERY